MTVMDNLDSSVVKSCSAEDEISLISKFFGFKDIPEAYTEKSKRSALTTINNAKLNIKDKEKITLTKLILDRWMLFNVSGDNMYVLHVASETTNTLYQIILGEESEWSGIYKLALKGKKVKWGGKIVDGRKTLVIESTENYEPASFQNEETGAFEYITRLDFENDEDFKKALLKTGFLDEEALECYFKPDAIIKPYLEKILPRIFLK